jgi:2-polyprenyl-3-methyl-5-hydroxy-6-metoxy-1,4-benzoquinol methylase
VAGNPNAQRLAELAALVDAVKERVRAQYPETTGNGSSGTVCVGLPDLTPLARARDAAAGKMAAIGTVNPRQGGAMNSLVQAVKRAIARGLNWFVRDQVIFNRQMITCVEVCIETLNDINRTIHVLAGQANTEIQRVRTEAEPLRREAGILRTKTSEFQDLVSHWNRWREEWQLKLHENEVGFLKSVADLNTTFQQKISYAESATQQRCSRAEAAMELLDTAFQKTATELEARMSRDFTEKVVALESDFRQSVTQTGMQFESRATAEALAFEQLANSNAEAIQGAVHAQISAMDQRLVKQAQDFEHLLATSLTELQKKFYADLDRIRTEYERVIHAELRVVRQRLATGVAAPPEARSADVPAGLPFDYARFADRFRGSEQYVTESQRFYLPYFTGRRHVLDLGCGRGEFLNLMRDAGVPAKGIEASDESVEHCRSLGLDADKADLFAYLSTQHEASLDGIFCSQVVEHLPSGRLPEMIRLCASRLATGGMLAIETPNPECLAIFASHFYLDPTHTRPVPSQLLAFYMEESGLGRIEIHPKAPAIESMPEVGELPAGFREKFFGGLDYAIIGYRL